MYVQDVHIQHDLIFSGMQLLSSSEADTMGTLVPDSLQVLGPGQ